MSEDPNPGAALFSGNWYRVAALKPRLRAHVRLHRHVYRGQVWYVVEDRAAGKYHRFNPTAQRVIGLIDGQRDLQAIWQRLSASLADDTPTQDEVLSLIGQLYAADLLQFDVTPDVAELFERGARQRRSRWLTRFANPVALRFALFDPDALLTRWLALAGPLARRWGLLLWLAVVLPALILMPSQWRELTGNFNERLLAADNLLLLALLFPLLKTAHELGHGLACKRFGGEVHEMGVMLLVFFPVPYVDASSSSAFIGKWPRILVGAAGMLTELFIAALAFYAWMLLEPGMTRSLAYNLMVLASFTTLLFNANPLLRYDGYYMLADWLESPNLGQRSGQYWQYLLRHRVLGIATAEAPLATRGEKRWFLFYAPLSFAYRMFVLFSIALFVAGKYFFIGVLVAAWGVWASVGMPLFKGLRKLLSDPVFKPRARRIRLIGAGSAAALLLLLFGLPLPQHTVVEGVLWPQESAILRVGGSGFVRQLHLPAGASAQAGTLVLETVDPALAARLDAQAARREQAQARYDAVFGSWPARAAQLQEELRRETAALQSLQEEAARLSLRASASGTLIVQRPQDLPGRYLKRGEVVAYLDTPQAPVVRVVVPQAHAQQVRQDSQAIEVRLAQEPGRLWAARLRREVPAAARELPSPALGTQGGGDIALDPHDPKGLQSLQSLFEFELELPEAPAQRFIGMRALVRFEHAAEPVAWRLLRGLRRLFLSHFQL